MTAKGKLLPPLICAAFILLACGWNSDDEPRQPDAAPASAAVEAPSAAP